MQPGTCFLSFTVIEATSKAGYYKAQCPDSNIVFLQNTLIGGEVEHSVLR